MSKGLKETTYKKLQKVNITQVLLFYKKQVYKKL